MTDDENAVDEDSDDDGGDAVQHVQHDAEERSCLRAGVLGDVDRDQDRDRYGHDRRDPDHDRAPDQRVGDPARLAEQRRGLGQEVEVELAEALVEDGAEHEREDEDGDERAEERDHRGELLDPAAATEVVRRRGDVVRVVDLGHAHPVDILRAFWNLFTIIWADTFVTSEITSRIAPR